MTSGETTPAPLIIYYSILLGYFFIYSFMHFSNYYFFKYIFLILFDLYLKLNQLSYYHIIGIWMEELNYDLHSQHNNSTRNFLHGQRTFSLLLYFSFSTFFGLNIYMHLICTIARRDIRIIQDS